MPKIEDAIAIVMIMTMFDRLMMGQLYQGDRISFACQNQLLEEMLTLYLKELQFN
jgi:hypothetical protein